MSIPKLLCAVSKPTVAITVSTDDHSTSGAAMVMRPVGDISTKCGNRAAIARRIDEQGVADPAHDLDGISAGDDAQLARLRGCRGQAARGLDRIELAAAIMAGVAHQPVLGFQLFSS